MQTNNDMKANAMERAGEWPEIERRTTERRAEVNPVPRVGGNTKPEPADAASRAMLPVTDSLVRYCPHCGLIGEPGEEYRDCCPDGIGAFMVPPKFAEQCRATFKLAIESVASPVAGWVSVEVRLPPDDSLVMVYVPDSQFAKVRFDTWQMQREAPVSFSSETVEIGFGWDEHEFEEITHWMPLPPAPVVTPTQQEQS